ncbi:DUF1761 domain-containing protein [Saccharicrinis sp. FJH54]|uniref:DUF1761 domain-containing protein n=1 Tax=Saccharicrinis sp. FJH54 TaxID=3344665 RepID=UPI0035D3E1E1
MELLNSFGEINWLSVVVSSIAAFAIGAVWYSPILVGNAWQKEINLSSDELKNTNMALVFGPAFVLTFIGAVLLELLLGSDATISEGLITGLIVSIGFITTALGINYLFARHSLKLFLIDAGYFIIFFAVMGIILGAW